MITGKFSLLVVFLFPILYIFVAGRGRSIGRASAWYADGRGFDPLVRQHSFMEIGHEIISTAILSRPLIQEVALSTGKLPRRLAQEQCG